MAQPASNAQREPSMEEILASIRRIIEDNEPAPREPEPVLPDTAIGPAANDPARSEVFGRMPADRLAPEAPPAVEPEILDEPVIDMEEISAAIEAETAREAVSPQWDVEALRSLDERLSIDRPLPSPAMRVPETQLEPAEARPSILSERTGRQVAASFGELSEAFAASRRRSFDEIAEEMMRPMLQDWLDNNLPTLVERLVREEIERVARGG